MTAPLPADPAPPARCPRCDAVLPADAPGGLCPSCLVSAHFGADATEPPAADAGASVTEIADLAPHFPQLEILACLGRGGMGVVYKARQKSLGRLVALKLLAPERVGAPAFAERFAREARALARLDHPHIVTIHDFGQAGGYFYLLMEFVDGVSLRQLVRDGRVAPREALAIVPQICDALQFAHDHGIVHRDIKPDNILLDRRGHAKVADFGLAKLIEPETDEVRDAAEPGDSDPAASSAPADLTEAGKVMGTPRYMAPEQRERPAAVDHRADIYALGVVLYQMLTGELPDEKQLQPPSRRVHIDVRLDEIVLRALEKDPERRYANATEFKTTLAGLGDPPPLAPPPPPPAAPFAATPPTPEARPGGLTRLKPAAIALIVTSALNLAKLAFGLVTSVAILVALPLIGGGPGPVFRFFGHSMHLAGVAAGLGATLVAGWMLLHAAANIYVISAARRMLAGRDPGRARAGAIVAIVLGALSLGYGSSFPFLNVSWGLLQIGAGVWAFMLMRQPEIRAAFSDADPAPPPAPTTPTPPAASTPSIKTPARRLRIPAVGLLVSAGLQFLVLATLSATFVLGASFTHMGGADKLRIAFLSSTRTSTTTPGDGIPPLWYSLAPYTLIGGLVITALVFVAAWRMRRLRGHTFALIGSLLAMAAIPVLGFIFGLWSLLVLLRRDVHAAFDGGAPRRRRKSVPLAACGAALLLAIFAAAQVLVTLVWEHDRREARHVVVEKSRATPFAPLPAPPSSPGFAIAAERSHTVALDPVTQTVAIRFADGEGGQTGFTLSVQTDDGRWRLAGEAGLKLRPVAKTQWDHFTDTDLYLQQIADRGPSRQTAIILQPGEHTLLFIDDRTQAAGLLRIEPVPLGSAPAATTRFLVRWKRFTIAPAPPVPEVAIPVPPSPPAPNRTIRPGADEPATPSADFAARLDAALRISEPGRRDQALAKLATDAVPAGQVKIASDATLRISEMALRNNTLHQLALRLKDAGRRDEGIDFALRIGDAALRDLTMQALAE